MLLEQLDQQLDVLKGMRDAPSRQQSLRATLNWSYRLLSEPERILLGRLAVFAGPWTLESAEVICGSRGVPGHEVMNHLNELVNKSLVSTELAGDRAIRYRLLETIRGFVREQAPTSTEDVVCRKHAEHYLSRAERAAAELRSEQQSKWLDELELDHDNHRAALSWAIQAQETTLGFRFGAALWRFWVHRGHLIEANRWLTRLLELPNDSSPSRREVLFAAGVAARSHGSLDSAMQRFRQLLRESELADDPLQCAAAATQLGFIASLQGNPVHAKQLHERALAIRKKHGLRHGVAISLAALGELVGHTGDRLRSRDLLDEALALARDLGDGVIVLSCLRLLAAAAISDGHHTAARLHLAEALTLARRLRDPNSVISLLNSYAQLAEAEGKAESAEQLLEAAKHLSLLLGRDVFGDATATNPAWTPADWAIVEEAVRANALD
jgi:tetratricopeptide (TPR) repeat protein